MNNATGHEGINARLCSGCAGFNAVSGSFGLAGCGSIDDLKDTVFRWFDIGKLLGARGGASPDDLADVTPMIPPKKMLKDEASKASKNEAKPARKLQRPQTVELPKKRPMSNSRRR